MTITAVNRIGRLRAGVLLVFAYCALGAATCREVNLHPAEELYKREDYKNAADQYRDFLRENPKSSLVPDAYLGLGWSEYRLSHFYEAADAAEQMRRRFPTHRLVPTATYLFALARVGERRYVEAAQELETLIREYPEASIVPEARFLMGRTQAAMLRPAAAAEQFRVYLDKYGESPYAAAALIGRAKALMKSAQWKEAQEMFEEFARRYPEHPERPAAVLELSALKQAENDLEAAELWTRRFLEDYPSHAEHRTQTRRLAELLMTQRRAEDAAALYKALYDAVPERRDQETVELAAWLAKFHADRSETAAARPYFERILTEFERWPEQHAKALEWMARYELGEGRREEARRHADRFAEIYFDHPLAGGIERMLVGLYVASGRIADGRDRLATFARKSYGSMTPDVFYNLASLSMQLAEYSRARDEAAEGLARARRGQDTAAMRSGLYHLMIINNLDGKITDAVRHYWALKDIAPYYITASEKIYWDRVERQFYDDNRVPLEQRERKFSPSDVRLAVHIAGIDFHSGDSSVQALAASVWNLLTVSITGDPGLLFTPSDKVRWADKLRRMDDFHALPDSFYPLRSNIGADWIIFGDVRFEPVRDRDRPVELTLRLLRVDYDGLFPFDYVTRYSIEDSWTAGPPAVRDVIEKLKLYRPER